MKGPVPAGRLWAKLEQDFDGSVIAWHPIADHCADVAACALALLQLSTWNRRLAALAGQTALHPRVVARLVVIVALHDLGKFSRGFQNKARVSRAEAETSGKTRGHVSEFFGLFKRDGRPDPRLAAAISFDALREWFEDGKKGLPQFLFASASHHGKPQSGCNAEKLPFWQPEGGLDPFEEMRAFMDQVRTWLPEAFEPGGPPIPCTPAFQHGFAGLVMLADWLGSGFAYSEEGESAGRWESSCSRAREVLAEMTVDPRAARAKVANGLESFETLFGVQHARAAQRALIEAPVPTAPSIEILEAETGSGKTEAALYRYLQLFAAGQVDGLYFALPTRTSAVQIETRVRSAVAKAFPGCEPAVTLAVPGYLQVDGVKGTKLPEFKVLWPDADKDRFRYRGWAAESSKRFLVGPIVIGTIDQILLSALSVAHCHLRATALLRHYLVVDEVHASDSYMNAVLKQVLRHHMLAGGHALLMSATLGGVARDQFLNLSHVGSREYPSLEQTRTAPYPQVTRSVGEACTAVGPEPIQKDVRVVRKPWMSAPEEIARVVLDAAQQGARVAVLRSTVRGALEVQDALERLADERGQRELLFQVAGKSAPHHSRFAKEDRILLDREVERRFGKDSLLGGCVVVATQTIEQSLDLDFDWLLTDLAPMDVLLQRVGRLHRHRGSKRVRPAAHSAPELVVLTPEERDLSKCIGKDGKARGLHGLGTVYSDLGVLEATWRELEKRPELRIPEQNRELVELTTHPSVLSGIVSSAGKQSETWLKHLCEVRGKDLAGVQIANLSCMPWNEPFGSSDVEIPATKLPTRLGEEDRNVEFDGTPPIGPFGKPVRRIALKWFMARGMVGEELKPIAISQNADGFAFSFGGERFSYGTWGLQAESARTAPKAEAAVEDE